MQTQETNESSHSWNPSQEVALLFTSILVAYAWPRDVVSGMQTNRGLRRRGAEELVAGNALDTLVVVCNMHSNINAEHECIAVG